MLLILLSVFLILATFYWLYLYITYFRYINKFPGKFAIPFLGNSLDFRNGARENFEQLCKFWYQFKQDNFRVYIGIQGFLVLTNPKDIEVILSSPTLIDKMHDYRFLRPWLGQGLLTSTGSHWHKHRKIITPTFHFKILNSFLDVINENSSNLIEFLKKKADGKTFDCQSIVHLGTLDIICETAMGVKINALIDSESVLVKSFVDICTVVQNRFYNPLKRIDIFYQFFDEYKIHQKALKEILAFNEDVIEKRKILLKTKEKEILDEYSTKTRQAFLDTLLTSEIDGKPLTNTEIAEEVSTFMFEGHDTVASGISFSLYILSLQLKFQETIFDEQTEIFGNDSSRNPTYQDIQNMKYLEMFIKETERLYPSVPAFGRYNNEPFDLNGKFIPAGTNIVIIPYCMGRDEKIFDKPDVLLPERFLSENREKTHPFEYIPFSAGPRNCIGQKFAMLEMKSVLSKIVRNFHILPSENKNYKPILSSVLTLKSENGVEIGLRTRVQF